MYHYTILFCIFISRITSWLPVQLSCQQNTDVLTHLSAVVSDSYIQKCSIHPRVTCIFNL